MAKLEVRLPAQPARSYPIEIRAGALESLPSRIAKLAGKRRVAVVTDAKVRKLYGERLLRGLHATLSRTFVLMFDFPAGERAKTRKTKAELEDALLRAGYGRDSLLVALGGGVVGDMAGFVAATFQRGVPYIQVPTTLLAMVDSSVGGKTGLDTPQGKNLIGAFWQPECVVIDPETLHTLPRREVLAGAAEVAKHGVIADARFFHYVERNLEKLLAVEPAVVSRCVRESCTIKAAVVSRDEREGGYRQILNFGHTIAHAIELVRNYRLLHGEAVWAGMAVEALLARNLGLLSAEDAARIVRLTERAYSPKKALAGVSTARVISATASDKKARGGLVRYALPQKLGKMGAAVGRWSYEVPVGAVRQALEEARSGLK